MPIFFFAIANMVVMYVLGHADSQGFFSLADPTVPFPFFSVLAVSLFMGLLSGAIIGTNEGLTLITGLLMLALHTASAFIPFVLGLGSLTPYALTFGVGAIFLLASGIVSSFRTTNLPQRRKETSEKESNHSIRQFVTKLADFFLYAILAANRLKTVGRISQREYGNEPLGSPAEVLYFLEGVEA